MDSNERRSSNAAKRSRLGVREIARRVGVSPMTVSRVLNNPDMVSPETRDKVLGAIERAGFVPNRLASSMRGAGRIIGTVVPPLINSGIAEQVQGMSDECHEAATRCCSCRANSPPRPRRRRSVRCSAGGRPGMILQSFVQSDAARALLVDGGVPVVEISEIKGQAPDRHGGRRLQFRDRLRHDHASRQQGLQEDRLRLDADPRQRPPAAAAHRLPRGADGPRPPPQGGPGGRGADHARRAAPRRWPR